MQTGPARPASLILPLLAALLAASFNMSCGGAGGAPSQTSTPAPPSGTGSGSDGGDAAIPPSFFAMTLPRAGQDFPPTSVPIGALGHPQIFAWGAIEQNQGSFDFTGFDSYVNDAVQHGLVDSNGVAQVTITFGDTPPFAAADTSGCASLGSKVVCPSPPANIGDWTNFIQAVISHYNGTTAPHVKYYELWNEANSGNFWTGSMAQLVELAQTAFPIIHQDPFALLLTPSVTGGTEGTSALDGVNFMTQYLQAGGGRFADGGTFHGYVAPFGGSANITLFPFPTQDSTAGCAPGAVDGCFGSIVTKVTKFRAIFDANGLEGKPMLDTEGSWGVASNLPDLNQQIAWVAQWNILQAAFYPQITQASWYEWGTQGPGQLEASPGAANAVGVAYGQVYNWLVGATFTSPCSSDSNLTWTCPITRPGGYQALAVWNENGDFSYSPSTTYQQFRDLAGNVTPLSGGPITIGIQPVLLENQNP